MNFPWLYKQRDEELDAEIRSHLDEAIRDRIERGESPDEARANALREFGNVGMVKEVTREMWGWGWLERLWMDLRFGLRMLLKHPGFTLATLISLAIGIGANTALFSLVNAVLWHPLPYPHAERLVTVGDGGGHSAPEFIEFGQQSQTLEHLAAFETRDYAFTGNRAALDLRGQRISAELLPLLGVTPQLGRAFAAAEFQPGRAQVVLISHSLWQKRFAADPQIIGQAVTLDERRYTVIGVLPPAFAFFPASDLLTPLTFNAEELSNDSYFPYNLVARLKPGVTLEQAQLGIRRSTNPTAKVRLVPLRERLVKDFRPTLFILWCVVALVLLIACTNFANLLLARAANRQKELAIRAALGAGRGRIVRQLLTESVLLSLLGGALGLLCAYWALHALVAANPAAVIGLDVSTRPGTIPRLGEVGIHWWAIGFTFGLSLLTGVLFGLAPALQFSKPDLNHSLKEGAAVTNAGFRLWRHQRTRSLLAISEIALALVLLIGAGLLIRSYWRLQQVKPWFQTQNLLTLQLEFPCYRYRTGAMVNSFVTLLSENLATLPGVESVGATANLPLSKAGNFKFFSIEGRPDIDQKLEEDLPFGWSPPLPPPFSLGTQRIHLLMSFHSEISPSYFQTMGILLQRGRVFDQHDDMYAQRVAIINEAMARRYWPNEDPLGKRIKLGSLLTSDPWLTIVGVVGNVRHYALEDKPRPEFYRPFMQSTERKASDTQARAAFRGTDTVSLVVRTSGQPAALAEAVQKLVWSFDQDQPIQRLATMEELLAEATAPRRFKLLLFGMAAVVALLLAGVGVYGVMAYLVAQRTHELGIRLALGAQRSDILRLVLGQGMQLALAGLALGLVAALALTRWLKNLLFGISATDPLTFVMIALLLAGITLLACYLPARRATRVDPLVALRHE
ncbi:MAG: ABC transporter permease [Blastocatellia bacterium]